MIYIVLGLIGAVMGSVYLYGRGDFMLGGVIGLLVAALIIAIIDNSLVHLGIDPIYVELLLGLFILGAVYASHVASRSGKPKRSTK